MATITTSGSIGTLLNTQFNTFDTAVNNVGDKLLQTLDSVYTDIVYDNFSVNNYTANLIDGYLYGTQGNFTLLGSGFYSSPKITQLIFDGDDGFDFNIAGSMTLSTIKITQMTAAWNGETLLVGGSLDEAGYGKVTRISVTTGGLTMLTEGSLGFADMDTISGTLKSVTFSDSLGASIQFKGSISAATFEAETSLTLGNALNSQVLLAGNDVLNVADATRAWHGYNGSDKLFGGSLDDELHGDEGNDKLYGYDGNDILHGGNGNDRLEGGSGNNTLIGGDGNDIIIATGGNNAVVDTGGNANITTADGDDDITTGGGNDKIMAGAGNNDIYAGAGNNKIVTLGGDDIIQTETGNDNINAGDGNNIIDDSGGNNKIISLGGNDDIGTGSGNDNINAGNGDNWILAGAGIDTIVTGSGNDIIISGDGADKITGGSGSDRFVFNNLNGIDTINDYLSLEDVLVFDDAIFTALSGGITSDNLVIGSGSSAVAADANDYLILNTTGGKLYYDADGNGAGAAVQIATLKSVTSFDLSHLIVE
jgi:Ca2+-binding RTX toxin-like protein